MCYQLLATAICFSSIFFLLFKISQMFSRQISLNKIRTYKILILYFAIIEKCAASSEPKLLIVSYDAFRYDYFERNLTPFMNTLKHSGSYSDYMTNIFITSTFPNHHSMATGLFAENHGVVDNEFYDVGSEKKFGYSYKLYHYNEDIIPIWTLNQKNGKHSGSMMWPGASMKYHKTNLTFNQNFDPTVNWTTRIDIVISWFKHKKTPMNFGLLYIEEPDHHGHRYGINNPVFNNVLKKLDDVTQYLHNKLIENKLQDVNVIHLSDHGMATVKYENIIDVRQYLNTTDYAIAGRSIGLNIFPKPGQTQTIFNKLKAASNETNKFDVYLKSTIPERYHYSNNSRIGDIFLSAKVGYAFYPLVDKISTYINEFNITITNETEFGVHGYDNEMKEMKPFFFAYGPAFKQKCKIKPFNNVDIYPLICEILHLKCPSNNGTLRELKSCLTFSVSSEKYSQFDLTLVGSCIGFIIMLFMVLLCQKRNSKNDETKERPNIVV